jgi:hypothetical protein
MGRPKKVAEIIPSGSMMVSNDKGGSLEVIKWHGEPAVIVDGQHIIKRMTLVASIQQAEAKRHAHKQ